MDEEIIEAYKENYRAQAVRLTEYFRNIFGASYCDGGEYPQIISCLNAIYHKEHSDDDLKRIITDGNGDGGLADAFVFTKDSVDIFEIKSSANLRLREIQILNTRLKDLIFTKPEFLGSDDIIRIKWHLKHFHAASNKRSRINVYIIRKSFAKLNADIANEIKKIERNSGVRVILLSNIDIVNFLSHQSFIEKWSLKKSNIDKLIETRESGALKSSSLVLCVPIFELLRLYEIHLKEKKDLFAGNIRYPKITKEFSAGIFESINNSASKFFLLHNGITIAARDIDANATSYIISNPQVVNGAQTIGNLFKKYNQNLKDKTLKKAKVLCKIIKADQDLTDLICETSNTQKAVKIEDLRRNDSFQKKLEIYIKNKSKGKYSYIRKDLSRYRGSINIKYVNFFRWAYASFFFQPARAKNARQTLFLDDSTGEYLNIKRVIQGKVEDIILLCDVGTFVEEKIKKEENKNKKAFLRHADLHIIAGLFYLRSTKKTDFDKIYKILSYSSREMIQKDKNLNYNKIFTKSNTIAEILKTKLI